jgi:hypothetical protein
MENWNFLPIFWHGHYYRQRRERKCKCHLGCRVGPNGLIYLLYIGQVVWLNLNTLVLQALLTSQLHCTVVHPFPPQFTYLFCFFFSLYQCHSLFLSYFLTISTCTWKSKQRISLLRNEIAYNCMVCCLLKAIFVLSNHISRTTGLFFQYLHGKHHWKKKNKCIQPRNLFKIERLFKAWKGIVIFFENCIALENCMSI